ncbi:hypothetical protein ACG02S_26160, partial [Roseateles sp. DC23W]
YNHHIPQRSLDHRSPVQALQAWQVAKPHLFKRAVYKQAGLDTYLPTGVSLRNPTQGVRSRGTLCAISGIRNSGADWEATLTAYCKTYNHHIPQRSLDHRSPVQALQAWQIAKPHLFKRAVYKQAGLDR